MSSTKPVRKRRMRLFYQQGGKCFWCGCAMIIDRQPPQAKSLPKNLCTLDHLDDRDSPERGRHAGELRTVAACWACNNRRAREKMAVQPLEERRLRSLRGAAKAVAPALSGQTLRVRSHFSQ